jgi:predicted permease
VGYRIVTVGYFDALDIPLVEGRRFRDTDDPSAEQVVIVNATMAHRLWPGESPLGRRLRRGRDGAWLTVVGVAGDVRFASLVAPPGPELFLPHRQQSMAAMMLAVRTSTDPARLAAPIRNAIWDLDPDVPVSHVAPMVDLVHASAGNRRFLTGLLAVFASVALALAAIGVYGVTAFAVGARTREIGVRMALGATGRRVQREVLWQGMRHVMAGVAMGLLGALALTRFLEGFVYGVAPTDAATYGGVASLVVIVAAAAILVPAMRATAVSPITALRR